MLNLKYSKNKFIISFLALVITFSSIVSLTPLANSNTNSANIKIETSTGEVLSIENSTNDFSAEITIDTDTGYIFEMQ
ncbi:MULTISPECIES: hypothetical protein [Clostridia]|mgnify:FL=1|jgi:hypothetical protein|uniref:hypothetical protein n=1 Tax=Clostridia TaxID=186801 RepID=UPI00097FEDC2|nr:MULTISPECIES: hypothetical protein [Clostridia]SJP45260.1 Uncharacterised protein [Clostridioides difficile]